MSDSEREERDFPGAIRSLVAAAVGVFETRVELFALEFQEERIRLIELVILAGLIVGLSIATVGVVTIGFILLFEGKARLAALAGLGLGYVLAAGWCYRILSNRLKTYTPFAGTLGEIKKDRECLRGKS
jgi:uncharacterized membrane protein YqjE